MPDDRVTDERVKPGGEDAGQPHSSRNPSGRSMPAHVARANAGSSAIRAAVEHVFAHQKNRFGLFIRTIGLARAEAKLTLANIAYNFDRLIFHERARAMRGVRPESGKDSEISSKCRILGSLTPISMPEMRQTGEAPEINRFLRCPDGGRILHSDKGYDSNAIRRQVEENDTMPNIPPKANRRWKG